MNLVTASADYLAISCGVSDTLHALSGFTSLFVFSISKTEDKSNQFLFCVTK